MSPKYQEYCKSEDTPGLCSDCEEYYQGKDCHNKDVSFNKLPVEKFNRRRTNALAMLNMTGDKFLQGYLIGLSANFYNNITTEIHTLLINQLHSEDKDRRAYSQGYFTGYKGALFILNRKGIKNADSKKTVPKHGQRHSPEVHGNI